MSDFKDDGGDNETRGPFDSYFESLEKKRFQGHSEFTEAEVVSASSKSALSPDLTNPIEDLIGIVKSPKDFFVRLDKAADVSGWMWAKALMLFFFSVWLYFVFDSSQYILNVNLNDASVLNLLKIARLDQFLSSGGTAQLQSALLVKNQWALIEAPFSILLSLTFLSFVTYFSLKTFKKNRLEGVVFSKVLYVAIVPYWFYPLKALPYVGGIGFIILHVMVFLSAMKIMTGLGKSNIFLYSYILTVITKILCIFLIIGLMASLLGIAVLAILMKAGL